MAINGRDRGLAGCNKILVMDGEIGSDTVPYQHIQSKKTEIEKMATIGETVCSISHDMRHSLSTIYATAEFLEGTGMCTHERMELLADIRQAVMTMTGLVDSLLQFASTGRSKTLVRGRISLIIESAIASVRKHPDGRNVSITLAMSSMPEANVDATRLESAIYNLLLNACQAASQSAYLPEVNVELKEIENWIYITITDNGSGVPLSIQKTLFDPFVSAGKPCGTGLGLTLARRIAEEHGGDICMTRSNQGRTVFTLSLTKYRLQSSKKKLPIPDTLSDKKGPVVFGEKESISISG